MKSQNLLSRFQSLAILGSLLALLWPFAVASAPASPSNAELPIYLPLVNGGYDPSSTVLIPAGEFQMGCDPAHNGGYSCSFDAPLHPVYLDAYTIDKYEVTNAEYVKCELAGVCPPPAAISSSTRPAYYTDPAYKNYPLINVSWYAANTYCTWIGKYLPTEAQWEKAARGSPGTRAFPWGDQPPDCTRVNGIYDPGLIYCVGDTSQVGSYPLGASPYGVLDMAGNVWEWVNDWHQSDYYSLSPYANPPGPASGDSKVIRGGSYGNSGLGLLLASRYGGDPAGLQ